MLTPPLKKQTRSVLVAQKAKEECATRLRIAVSIYFGTFANGLQLDFKKLYCNRQDAQNLYLDVNKILKIISGSYQFDRLSKSDQ